MPTEAKRETVAELTEEARSSSAMIVSEYRGLKVSDLGEIRRNLRKQNVTYQVVKNRLMKIAARDAGSEALGILLEGPTAIAFAKGDEGAAAKAVLDAFRPYRLIKVTGAVIGDRVDQCRGGRASLAARPDATYFWRRSPARLPRRWPRWPDSSTPRFGTSPDWSGPLPRGRESA